MRALLATFGTRGDLQPLIALALGLRAKGHRPAICAPPDFAEWVRGFDLPYRSVGSSMRELLRQARLSPLAATAQLKREIDRHFEVLEEESAGADVVIASGAEVAARSVAEKRGAAYWYLSMSPQQLPSRHHPPPYVPWPSLPSLLNAGTWAVVGATFRVLGSRTLNRHRERLGLPRVSGLLDHLLPRRALVGCDPLLGPLPPDLEGIAEQPGALLLDDPAKLPPEVEAFLARGDPPVCAGFGSMSHRDPAQATAALVGACRAAGKRLLLLGGWAGLGEGFAADDVLTCPELPLPAVLPRACAIVHHGGSGTTITAARAGVPQVLVPHFLDQPYWAMRVQALGIGSRPVPSRRLSSSSLAAALREALEPGTCERARALATRIRTDGVERAVALLERAA